MNTSIILSQRDIYLLNALFVDAEVIPPLDLERQKNLERLVASSSLIHESRSKIPAAGLYDLVTVNHVSAPAHEAFEFELVMPHEADIDTDRISVLAPLGMAILGRQLGDKVSLESPDGVREMRILAIRQKAEAV